MRIRKKENIFTGNYLRFITKNFTTENGHDGLWESVERTNVTSEIGAVVVVPLTKNKELIFEKNWRVALESPVIQFPAGLVDRKGESREETARRELLEETGYLANELVHIMRAPECAVLTSNKVDYFFATGVEYMGKENEDITEEIEVMKIPIKEYEYFLLNLPQGTVLDLQVPGIIWVLEKKGLI
jgi:ADP-ribose pyrophosphatase